MRRWRVGWQTGCKLTTDGHRTYLKAVEGAFGADIDYAMLVKHYGEPTGSVGRFSPDDCTSVSLRRVEGHPEVARWVFNWRRQQLSQMNSAFFGDLGQYYEDHGRPADAVKWIVSNQTKIKKVEATGAWLGR